MYTVSLVGFAKSGKSTLLALLAHCFETRGLRVAVAKHTHHGLDKPDTDTGRLCAPGRPIIGLGPDESALFFGGPRHLADLLPLLEADILLVEGGKSLGWLPRVICLPEAGLAPADNPALLRPELAFALFCPGKPDVSTGPGSPFASLPCFGPEQLEALADSIVQRAFTLPGLDCGACGEADCAGLAARIVAGKAEQSACKALASRLEVSVGGQALGLNPFTAGILEGGIRGMLSSLKGYAPGQEILVRIKA